MDRFPVRRKIENKLPVFRRGPGGMFRSFLENLDFPVGGEKFWPAVDIVDRDDAIVVKAELPGCRAEDIDVSIHGNMLTISGEKKAEREKKEKGYYRVESSYGSFQRCIQLPAEVRQDKIEAVCKDGILTMTMPKSQPSRSIKVKVKENKE